MLHFPCQLFLLLLPLPLFLRQMLNVVLDSLNLVLNALNLLRVVLGLVDVFLESLSLELRALLLDLGQFSLQLRLLVLDGLRPVLLSLEVSPGLVVLGLGFLRKQKNLYHASNTHRLRRKSINLSCSDVKSRVQL